MIDQVATISTNNDPELGKIIADAFRSVGKNPPKSCYTEGIRLQKQV